MGWRQEHAPLIHAECANPGLSQIGVVICDGGLVRDALIARCAASLVASGYRLSGVVQSNAHRHGRRRCLHTMSSQLSDFRWGFNCTSKARQRGNYGLVPECD